MHGWIDDGDEEYYDGLGRAMHIGGAYSVDRDQRIMGYDMWPDEELSVIEFNALIDQYEAVKPDIMITHDAPNSAALKLFSKNSRTKFEYPCRSHATH